METKERAAKLNWDVKGNSISRTFEFASPEDALAFFGEVGKLANDADHHPSAEWSYRTVRITLSTHSAGGVTEKDFALAEKINSLEKP